MSNLSTITGNSDPVLVMSATGTGASAITFIHDSGAENNYPGPLFPSVYEFAITDIVGVFSLLQINLEWSPITATGTPQFQTIGTWSPLTSPTAFFPCSSTGTYRLNCTAFGGGTSFNIYASIASSMPQGSGGGGGGGSVTQGTVPWIDNVSQVAGVALGATAIVNYGSTPAAVAVPAVNAFITNAGSIGGGTQYADNASSGATPTGVLDMGWDSANLKVRALKVDANQNLLVALGAALPAGTNVIGHVIVDSGSVSVSNFPNPQIVAGAKTPTDSYANPTDAEDAFALLGGWDATNTKWQRVQVDPGTGTVKVDPGIVSVTGTVTVSNFPTTIDVTDRVTRLVGVVYGSQAQQLKQTATNFNLQVELATGGVLYDARQIYDANGNKITTNSINTGGFPAAGAVDTNILSVRGTAPTQAGYVDIKISDGTNGVAAVKPASTAAIATDPALVVALSPNNPVSVTFPAVQVVSDINNANNPSIPDLLRMVLTQLKLLNYNLASSMNSAYSDWDSSLIDTFPTN